MAIATLEEYLREFSVEIGDRILTSFPALHSPGEPVSPIVRTLLRKPFAAQEVAIAGAAKRLQQANSVAIIAEMGTGKTLMAMAIAHVFAAGRPYACRRGSQQLLCRRCEGCEYVDGGPQGKHCHRWAKESLYGGPHF